MSNVLFFSFFVGFPSVRYMKSFSSFKFKHFSLNVQKREIYFLEVYFIFLIFFGHWTELYLDIEQLFLEPLYAFMYCIYGKVL